MLKNKNAVITGGSDGIGLAIAKEFAKNGANVCLIGRDENKLIAAKKELDLLGSEVFFIKADLSELSQIESVSKHILKLFPKLDVLVNNAGIGRFIPFTEMNLSDLDMHIDLNVRAPYMLTKHLFASLSENKGNVINISSYFSHRMLPGRSTTAYSLTKGAIDSFTKALAFEAGAKGVRVNGIAPGSIDTPQLRYNLTKLNSNELKEFEDLIQTIYPLGRIGQPEDVAQMAVFLASDRANWITGAIYSVDGGLTTN
ncbi:SDR family NAD(P)-dependent oxidoreductase [Dysgonomonas sp. ZJ279]|uniref:SDR family NAD(P)-dependent oxidoreductase n=1 Tax=Dysgonomonas sp. ZJ279 TaxID=2709796 RepID=UPI002105CEA7|nr:SDR family oxidoreductase [Dysgonomonas sp. ZJ279]